MAQVEKTFIIEGMSCGGCVNSLTRVLKTVPGIEPVKIEVGKAALRLDSDKVDGNVVKAAVERAGFALAGKA
jgi:copper chaperone